MALPSIVDSPGALRLMVDTLAKGKNSGVRVVVDTERENSDGSEKKYKGILKLVPGDVLLIHRWTPGHGSPANASQLNYVGPVSNVQRIPLRLVQPGPVDDGELKFQGDLRDYEWEFLGDVLSTNRTEFLSQADKNEWALLGDFMAQERRVIWNGLVRNLSLRIEENSDAAKRLVLRVNFAGLQSWVAKYAADLKPEQISGMDLFAKAFSREEERDAFGINKQYTSPFNAIVAQESLSASDEFSLNGFYYAAQEPWRNAFYHTPTVILNGLDFKFEEVLWPEAGWSIQELLESGALDNSFRPDEPFEPNTARTLSLGRGERMKVQEINATYEVGYDSDTGAIILERTTSPTTDPSIRPDDLRRIPIRYLGDLGIDR